MWFFILLCILAWQSPTYAPVALSAFVSGFAYATFKFAMSPQRQRPLYTFWRAILGGGFFLALLMLAGVSIVWWIAH